MDSTLKLILFLCFGFLTLNSVRPNSDYNTLIYKNCSIQTITDPFGSYSQTLSSLFQELQTQSYQSNFFTTIRGNDQSISGLFQCRQDLTNNDCHNCVHKLSELSNTLCSISMAARIQLYGCYIQYGADDGSLETSKHELIYKICSEPMVGRNGFTEIRDDAFADVEIGVVNGNGYYIKKHELFEIMAQCQGDLGHCDCGQCVGNALEIARNDCGYSISSQIYLDTCFLTYTFYPHRAQTEKGRDNNSRKSVAIVLGGAAALFLGFIFFMFIKSFGKKDEDY